MPEISSVLVYVGLDRVGDAILKLPFVRGLRQAFPNARITWVAGRETSVYAGVMAPVVKGLIDEVIENAHIGLSPKEFLSSPLPGRKFDLIIDTQRVALGSLVLWSKVKHQRFISPFANFFFSDVKPGKDYKFPKMMLRQVLDLLEIASGQKFPTPAGIAIDVDPLMRKEAAALLPQGQTYVGFAPGAGGLPKCWPLENFIAVAKRQEEKGRKAVFLLGPAEKDWFPGLQQALPLAIFPLQIPGIMERYKFSPLFTIALGKVLQAALANDSGVGHMLAVSGVPLVSLFGPTSPEKFRPMSSDLEIIEARNFGGREMARIPVQTVDVALEKKLTKASLLNG